VVSDNGPATSAAIVAVDHDPESLGAAGVLEGRPATTNWFFSGMLNQFGARYRRARWVHAGSIIMSAGVSAGIEMALYLTAKLTDEPTARRIQLALDYDPRPPFGGIDWQQVSTLLVRRAKRLQRSEAAAAA
jgi:transcriptional regulator GlxA family with amidase domain